MDPRDGPRTLFRWGLANSRAADARVGPARRPGLRSSRPSSASRCSAATSRVDIATLGDTGGVLKPADRHRSRPGPAASPLNQAATRRWRIIAGPGGDTDRASYFVVNILQIYSIVTLKLRVVLAPIDRRASCKAANSGRDKTASCEPTLLAWWSNREAGITSRKGAFDLEATADSLARSDRISDKDLKRGSIILKQARWKRRNFQKSTNVRAGVG